MVYKNKCLITGTLRSWSLGQETTSKTKSILQPEIHYQAGYNERQSSNFQDMSRHPYAQRLTRDVAELFSHNFNCSSSSLNVVQMSDSLQTRGSLLLHISIYEGPYRGGCFSFGFDIPESYPFRSVDIFATQPIWHPNIDLYTGKVALPMEWSPVLTLNSLALAVQVP